MAYIELHEGGDLTEACIGCGATWMPVGPNGEEHIMSHRWPCAPARPALGGSLHEAMVRISNFLNFSVHEWGMKHYHEVRSMGGSRAEGMQDANQATGAALHEISEALKGPKGLVWDREEEWIKDWWEEVNDRCALCGAHVVLSGEGCWLDKAGEWDCEASEGEGHIVAGEDY